MQSLYCVAYSVKASANVIEPPEFCGVDALFTVHFLIAEVRFVIASSELLLKLSVLSP